MSMALVSTLSTTRQGEWEGLGFQSPYKLLWQAQRVNRLGVGLTNGDTNTRLYLPCLKTNGTSYTEDNFPAPANFR